MTETMLRARAIDATASRVDQLEQRIRRRFDPDHSRVGLQRALELVGVRKRDVGKG
jgi:hypothetical protein